ncbi:ROK family transcriptional regulator [Baekduia sp. Peel2402]|uniref:ROK family transcriptional regulator n=1 Tax=Baekduia sp. Peel2402 TaxID=3458296 RepID=UPI00403E92F1
MGHEGSGSLESLRERNRRRVLSALRVAGITSRAELARRTGLSRTTVSSLIGDLVRDGLVAERVDHSAAPGAQGGRPPVLVSLDRRAGAAVGVDFGKSHVTVAVADLGHTVLAEMRRELPSDHRAEQGLDAAAELVDAALTEAAVDRSCVLGVGMGLPGPVHADTGTVGSTSILPGWVGVTAARAMSDRLNLPVRVDNDANLGALAEHVWGAGDGVEDMIYLKLATGIGAGLVLRGRLYVGVGGTAGEIGHTIIDEHGPVCRCANRGCLETLASGAATVDLLRPTLGEDLTLGRVVELTIEGHPAATRVVADAGRHIGRAVANLVNLLNPSRVVVGGEMAACGDVLLDPLRAECQRHAISSAGDDVEIHHGPLGDRAQVLGALALVLQDAETFSTPVDHLAEAQA